MDRTFKKKAFWLAAALTVTLTSFASSFAQTKPLFQDIPLAQPSVAQPAPTATPLVTKTGSSMPLVSRRTSIPSLMSLEIPGYTGILVESAEGNIVLESNADTALNPASNVKIAAAYAVLKTFGPDYRFPTSVWTDGQIDRATGTLYGNLYISGRDPVFNLEHGVTIAHELNKLGIINITGDLIVTDNFMMSYSPAARAATLLQSAIDPAKRTAAIVNAWQNYLRHSGKANQITMIPGVSHAGGVYVQSIPTNARLLFSHESAPMREIIKATLCFSNNFLSDRLGDMLGGAFAVGRFVQLNAGIAPAEFSIATSSGLGINRVTPRAMMKLLRVLQKDLARFKMTFADIMPVAGIDDGTLEGRFDEIFERGSVVGKTGTMNNTDGGVSALAGEMSTRNGKILFVIFNQRGSVARFQNFQNSLVPLIQSELGGALPISYNAVSLDVRLAKTRVTYPDARQRKTEEE